MEVPQEGRKRFRGRLRGVEGEECCCTIWTTTEIYRLPFSDIGRAKLILTDELIAATADRRPSPDGSGSDN